jgi:predicted TPR repeat methyltransferase
VGFGDLSRKVSRVLAAMLREGGHITGVVVDLGCGTGILAREIAAAGFTVVGIDLSPSMIAVAESHAPNAQFRVGSLHDFDLPPCVAVCAVGEGLRYLRPGEWHNDLRPLFLRVSAALEPGGLFLFDVDETGKAEAMSYHASRSGPGWEVEVVVSEDANESDYHAHNHHETVRGSGCPLLGRATSYPGLLSD